jgi:hypothetical protein
MLQLPDPTLMRALSRYHADGQMKDRHAHHRHALTQILRQERRDRWMARWSALRSLWPRTRVLRRPCET